MLKRINFDKIILFIALTLLIFYGFLYKFFYEGFKYIDEAIVLGLVLYFMILVFNDRKFKISKKEITMIIWIGILSIIGFLGNAISAFQSSFIYIMVDWFAFLKFPLTYFLLLKIIETKYGRLSIESYRMITNFFKIITIIIAIIVISNILFDLDLGAGYSRYNLPSYSLGGHPTFAAAVSCCLASYFMINYRKNIFWIILNFILCAATLRMKAIVWVVLMIGLLLLNIERKFNKRKLFTFLTVGLVVTLLISFKSIQFYFLSTHASRNNALVGSLKIANEFLPVGGGFATFGTISSISSYSLAYYFTNLNNRWGFMPGNGSFVGDGGWATEIGQFGYLGVCCCILYLINLYLNSKKKNKNSIYSVISIFMYIVIASTSENALGSEYVVLFGIVLAIISSLAPISTKGRMI